MRSTTFLQSCCHMHTVSFRLRLFSLVWSTRHKLCCYPILKMCWRDMIPRAKFPWNSWPSSSSLCLWIMQVVTAFATLQFCCHDSKGGGESSPVHFASVDHKNDPPTTNTICLPLFAHCLKITQCERSKLQGVATSSGCKKISIWHEIRSWKFLFKKFVKLKGDSLLY